MSGTALLTVRMPVAGRTVGVHEEVPTRFPTCGLLDVVSRVNIGGAPCGARTAAAARVAVFFGSAISNGRCKIALGSELLAFDISTSASAGKGVMVAIQAASGCLPVPFLAFFRMWLFKPEGKYFHPRGAQYL